MNTPENPITGLHHVTAIASDPQQNIDFYVGLLGLRLVKKTVNFDDPSAYHLYYGDESGTPGTIVTFFYWPGLDARGRVGPAQSTAIVFSAPTASLDFWENRLRDNDVVVTRARRFGEQTLRFTDPDGIPLEIVAVADDSRPGWTAAKLPAEHALHGLHTAELTVHDAKPTAQLLTETLGFRKIREDANRIRFASGNGVSGTFADLIVDPSIPSGSGGSGTIHHIAWSVPDDVAQLHLRDRLRKSHLHVSSVRDRDYFRSIYFPEPGGILFEIATATPGFTADEPLAELGASLQLPAQFAHLRAAIEETLPSLQPAKPAK